MLVPHSKSSTKQCGNPVRLCRCAAVPLCPRVVPVPPLPVAQITGSTIFNVLRMQEIPVDSNDRPVNPPRITSVEVLMNPFDDIVPRSVKQAGASVSAAAAKAAEAKKKENPMLKKKALGLLSFGEDAEQDEEEITRVSKGATSVVGGCVLSLGSGGAG